MALLVIWGTHQTLNEFVEYIFYIPRTKSMYVVKHTLVQIKWDEWPKTHRINNCEFQVSGFSFSELLPYPVYSQFAGYDNSSRFEGQDLMATELINKHIAGFEFYIKKLRESTVEILATLLLSAQ